MVGESGCSHKKIWGPNEGDAKCGRRPEERAAPGLRSLGKATEQQWLLTLKEGQDLDKSRTIWKDIPCFCLFDSI